MPRIASKPPEPSQPLCTTCQNGGSIDSGVLAPALGKLRATRIRISASTAPCPRSSVSRVAITPTVKL
ncbi:hypothetical protein [Rathayibacter tanaceti]|uniref:hypothetical protein n=1 Tax=Rathayibacter tanaceti TaxID=1671680 RepID=UPI0008351013|nr:hypothetical protein [Rathayibacter tanaceti]